MQLKFRAIDLFAGIGGIRIGFQQAFKDRIKFIFTNDNDKYCSKTYKTNFGKLHKFHCKDIRDIEIHKMPEFNILLAGFPCQPFSKAGFREGFKDPRANIFYCIEDIIKEKIPEVIFLENVKNLIHHEEGLTFTIIKFILKKKLKYNINYKVLNAKNFGLPQNRERLYIVGFKKKVKFVFPHGSPSNKTIIDILEDQPVSEKYYLSQRYLNPLKKHKDLQQKKKYGFGYKILKPTDIANTIVCGGMGKERNLIRDHIMYKPWEPGDDPFKKKNNQGIRNMTEREWTRLQGFPNDFKFPVSMTQTYKQVANSVPIPVVKAIAEKIKIILENNITLKLKKTSQMSIDSY